MALKPNEEAEKWVAYLHGLGPASSNTNAFDEWLTLSVRATGVRPLEIACASDTEIIRTVRDIVSGGKSAVVLLTGMAGDGKTRMARVVWESLACGSTNKSVWDEEQIPTLELSDGNGNPYKVTFVKDMSGDMDTETDSERACKTITEVSPATCRVIACNHGRLLERIRGEENAEAERLSVDIEKLLFKRIKKESFETQAGHTVHLFDLSVYDPSEKFEQVLEQVCGRSEWQKCEECPCYAQCVINRNRLVLWDDEKKELRTPAKRQAEIIRLIGCNGVHLPIRDLLIVASNDILGMHSLKSSRKRKRLMSCADVFRAQRAGEPLESYVFSNLLGENILPADRKKNIVFREFPRFGIGKYAPRYADKMLTDGALSRTVKNSIGEFVSKWLWGLNSQYEEQFFSELLQLRRQALFFSYPDKENFNRWTLTAFTYGDAYAELLSRISQPRYVSPLLVRGMNRVFTGQYIFEDKVVWVTTAGTDSTTMQGELLRCEIKVRQRTPACGVFVQSNTAGLPIIRFKEPDVELESLLTPHLFEFFMRMGAGYVPDSFSKECLSQAFQLKFKLIKHFAVDTAESDQQFDEISLQTLSMDTGTGNNITVKI